MVFLLYCSYNGYLAGYEMAFDTSKSKLTKSNFALGYEGGDFTLHTNVYVSCLNISIAFSSIYIKTIIM